MSPHRSIVTAVLVVLATAAGCTEDVDTFATRITTTIADDQASTTISVDAYTRHGTSPADYTASPRGGLMLVAGPVGGDLMVLGEPEPGRYALTLPVNAPAYQLEIEGDRYVHGAGPLTSATIVWAPATGDAVLTIAPPVVESEYLRSVSLTIDGPGGPPPSCTGWSSHITTGATWPLPACLFPVPGRYRVEVTSELADESGDHPGDYVYHRAHHRTTRQLTLDVP